MDDVLNIANTVADTRWTWKFYRYGSSPKLFKMWFGQIGTTYVYVWANSFDDAWEHAVEWLDDNHKIGYFETLSIEDIQEAAKDLGIEWKPEWQEGRYWEDEDFQRAQEHAEADLTIVGHTTLKNVKGIAYVPSYEWGGDEVDPADEEYQEVLTRSERARYTYSKKLGHVIPRRMPKGY